MRPKYPVEAYAVAGGEFESTRIDWDDYGLWTRICKTS